MDKKKNIQHEIYLEKLDIDLVIEFEVFYHLEDDSFDHAFGTKKIEPYYALDTHTLVNNNYDSRLLQSITDYINDNTEEIEEHLISKL